MNLFRMLNKQSRVTIVMVTHEEKALEFSDRWIKLSDGKVR